MPGGLAFAVNRDLLGTFQGIARTYGDVSMFKVGKFRVALLVHPDDVGRVLVSHQHDFVKGETLAYLRRIIGNGLLTSEGDFHLRQRRLIQPIFHHSRLGTYGQLMVERAERTAARWRPGERVDASAEMVRAMLGNAAKALLDTEVEDESSGVGRWVNQVLTMANRAINPLAPVLDALPLPSNFRFRTAKRHLDELVFAIIGEHRSTQAETNDLLARLMAARDDGDHGQGMTDAQIRDEVMTLFLAGYETVASALTWTWFLLAQNPSVEARLHAELDEVLGERAPTVEDLPDLVYTRQVASESLRLCPPVPALNRQAVVDVEAGGYEIPTGTIVVLSPYVTQRDARFFHDPTRFDPDRWKDEWSPTPRLAFFPFGGGARMCVGESFAWMELILVLATLASRWRLVLEPGTRVEPRVRVTLRPKGGLPMRVLKR